MTTAKLLAWTVWMLLQGYSLPAHASLVAGITLPDQAEMAGVRLQLNGGGLRRLFGFRIYVAALYLPRPTHDAPLILEHDQPRRLQLTLLRDVSTQQNLEALKGGLIDNNSETEMAAIEPEVAHFLALLQQVDEIPAGSAIQLDYLPGKGTTARIGNRTLGTIPGLRFNRALLKIWLGNHPIQLSLKQSLLGSL